MKPFTVYPAIDLRSGKVVRLRQGKADQQQIYSERPELVADEWVHQGAVWLHVVNLDGAFGENAPANLQAIRKIISIVKEKAKVQLGGGIRTLEQIRTILDQGISRVVLGTAIVENPKFAGEALSKFGGGRIAFGLDARGAELMSRGWQSKSGVDLYTLAEQLAGMGAKTLIYTNIQKDGMQTGVDLESTLRLAAKSGVDVIASGGVATLKDVAKVRRAGLAGVIVGKALYEGSFSLKEALNVR